MTSPSVDTILVVQADGKGVAMVQPPAQAHTWRLGKGQKRSKKQEAVVTALYTMTPYQRTPQEAAAPLHDSERSEPVDRPQPVGKELRGTLGGKAVALSRLAQRVAQRKGPHIQHRMALTVGAEALQQQLMTHVPAHSLYYPAYSWYLAAGRNVLFRGYHKNNTTWNIGHEPTCVCWKPP